MCDYVSGELVLSFAKTDVAAERLISDIRQGRIEHVDYLEDLDEKLWQLELKADEDLDFKFHRVRVPSGEEQWKITYLQFFYKRHALEIIGSGKADEAFFQSFKRSDYQFTAAPNYILTLAAPPPLGKSTIKVGNFSFSKFHSSYKNALDLPLKPSANLNQVEITILD